MPIPPPQALTIEARVAKEWASAERLRTMVRAGALAAGLGDDAAEALSVTTAELVENAVKYGGESAIGLRVHAAGGRAEVAVEAASADPAQAARLFETLAWLASFPDAEAAYRARVEEIAGAPPGSESRLGLVRLAYEAGCTLRAERVGEGLRIVGEIVV